jgi:tripartite-type tricarboxylate transporter receptor subunit TctC
MCVRYVRCLHGFQQRVLALAEKPLLAVTLAGLALAGPLSAVASPNAYPAEPIRLIVPYSPGGHTDLTARVIADGLGKQLNKPVIVENKAGATGSIGMLAVTRAEPDGYTLGLAGSSNFVLLPLLRNEPPYKPAEDFSMINVPMTVAFVLVVANDSPFKTAEDLVTYAKKNSDTLTYASSGVGGIHHVGTEYFNELAGIKTRNIPYKGGSENVSALLGGQIDFMFEALSSILPQIKAGTVRALGVTPGTRVSHLPDVPTILETGVAGKYQFSAFSGLVGPAGMSASVKDTLAKAMSAALRSPEVIDRLNKLGTEVAGLDEKGFEDRLAAEISVWNPLIQRAGIPKQ